MPFWCITIIIMLAVSFSINATCGYKGDQFNKWDAAIPGIVAGAELGLWGSWTSAHPRTWVPTLAETLSNWHAAGLAALFFLLILLLILLALALGVIGGVLGHLLNNIAYKIGRAERRAVAHHRIRKARGRT
jgi:hypothetical protein